MLRPTTNSPRDPCHFCQSLPEPTDHFPRLAVLHVPGPTHIPARMRLAMARPAIDFTGPEFVRIRDGSLERLKGILKTRQAFAYAASGNGA